MANNACGIAFDNLSRTLGLLAADQYLSAFYDKYARSGAVPSVEHMTRWMTIERKVYLNRKQYIDALWTAAERGQLLDLWDRTILERSSYYLHREAIAFTGEPDDARLAAIDEAANWITLGAWEDIHDAAIGTTREQLKKHIPATAGAPGPMGTQALGLTDKHLCDIHSVLATDRAAQQPLIHCMPSHEKLTYTSSVGGSVLRKYAFQMVAGKADWPRFGDARWEIYALFFVAAIVIAQGFSDGNKRAGHMAYSIILIKNTHQFNAPTVDREKELFDM